MTTLYRLDVYDTSGVLQAQLTDFTSLAFSKSVNAPGILQFGVKGDHGLLASLADKWQLEAWRKPEGGAWYREFVGLYRSLDWQYTDRSIFTGYCPGLMSLLSWRHVAWKAKTANRSLFSAQPSETIMKNLVTYNAASSATVANGREREGAITGLTVEADGAAGTTQDWSCAWDNLLTTLQKLALIAGGDFDLVKTSSTAWQFRWYTGQLGTDRSATVLFAMNRGNMANPVYTASHVDEKTVAIVGGAGQDDQREIAVRTGADYNVTTNNIEVFVQSNNTTGAGLNSAGDQKLAALQFRDSFKFDAIQTPACKYFTHYVLGDLVTAQNPFNGTDIVVKCKNVAISFSGNDDGNEVITPTFEVA